MIWREKHSNSASQRDRPSRGGTCPVHDDITGQRAVNTWRERPPRYRILSFSSIYRCRSWRETLVRTFTNAVTAVCFCDQCGWAVWLAVLRQEHWGSFSNMHARTFSFHPATKSPQCSVQSSKCLAMSLYCRAEAARNSRLDVLCTNTFTSVDTMS